MLKSHYGQVRVNNNLETRTFARDLFSLFVSPGCKTEMMTFHGDIFNCLGQGNTVRVIILFFLDRPHCAQSVLPRSWDGFLPAEISYLVIKRHIPSPYKHIPETCLSVNHCVFVYVSLTLLVLQMNLICMCSFLFCENVQRLKNKLKEMSSSQEDLSKMSVKVLNLPFNCNNVRKVIPKSKRKLPLPWKEKQEQQQQQQHFMA